MKAFFITGLLFTICMYGHAQDSTAKKLIKYKIWVTEKTNITKSGYLSHISDSVVYISNVKAAFDDLAQNTSQVDAIHYSNLKTASIVPKGAFGRSVLHGAIVGTLIGTFLGLIALPDEGASEFIGFPAATRALAGASSGILLGSFIGAIHGATVSKTFTINGNKKKFNHMQLTVLEHVYGKN